MWDLAAFVEGPPPFALNGNKITDLDEPPSAFYFGNEEQETFTVTTSYDLSLEASMGFGPVDLSVRGYCSENYTRSATYTTNVVTKIAPPLDESSHGVMTYIFVAPTIQKTIWEQVKNDYSQYNPKRYITFFRILPPQQKTMTVPLDSFPQSLDVFDLNSYMGREVQTFPGFSVLKRVDLNQDISHGVSQTVTIQYSETNANSQTKGVEVSMNISAGFGLFDFSAGASAGCRTHKSILLR